MSNGLSLIPNDRTLFIDGHVHVFGRGEGLRVAFLLHDREMRTVDFARGDHTKALDVLRSYIPDRLTDLHAAIDAIPSEVFG